MTSKKIIIDCDPGIDDSLALLFALGSGVFEIEAITSVGGNVSAACSYDNIRRVLYIAKKTPFPFLGKGSDRTLTGCPIKARGVHGKHGLGDADLPALKSSEDAEDSIDVITGTLLADKADIIIATGPLTNLAGSILRDPAVKDKIKRLYIMGGFLGSSYAGRTDSEFNLSCDPEAARVVFCSGIPITLISLDVTCKAILKSEHLSRLKKSGTELAKFIVDIAEYSMEFGRKHKNINGAYIHDVLAVYMAEDESAGKFKDLSIGIDTLDCPGRIYMTGGPANVRFCEDFCPEAFVYCVFHK